jgi:hypothetical protein
MIRCACTLVAPPLGTPRKWLRAKQKTPKRCKGASFLHRAILYQEEKREQEENKNNYRGIYRKLAPPCTSRSLHGRPGRLERMPIC